MNTRFKSALNRIQADEALTGKTEEYLRSSLAKGPDLRRNEFKKRRMIDVKKFAIAACVAVLLIGGGAKAYSTPLSYVSIDINPSVELGVNFLDQVVSAEGYNEDGKKVLSKVKVKGKNVAEAVSTVVDSAADNGYILDDGSTVVAVTAVTDKKDKADKLKEKAEEGAKEALKENNKSAEVSQDQVALERRDQARELGISPGKLNLIQKLQAFDEDVTIEQYKDAPVKDIMKAIKDERKADQENSGKGNVENNKNKDAKGENQGKGTLKNKDNDSEDDEGNVTDEEEDSVNKGNNGTQNKENKGNGNSKPAPEKKGVGNKPTGVDAEN